MNLRLVYKFTWYYLKSIMIVHGQDRFITALSTSLHASSFVINWHLSWRAAFVALNFHLTGSSVVTICHLLYPLWATTLSSHSSFFDVPVPTTTTALKNQPAFIYKSPATTLAKVDILLGKCPKEQKLIVIFPSHFDKQAAIGTIIFYHGSTTASMPPVPSFSTIEPILPKLACNTLHFSITNITKASATCWSRSRHVHSGHCTFKSRVTSAVMHFPFQEIMMAILSVPVLDPECRNIISATRTSCQWLLEGILEEKSGHRSPKRLSLAVIDGRIVYTSSCFLSLVLYVLIAVINLWLLERKWKCKICTCLSLFKVARGDIYVYDVNPNSL